MRIEHIVRSERNPEEILILFDGNDVLTVSEEDVLHFSLRKGMEIDSQTYDTLRRCGQVAEVTACAVRMLSRRPLSRAELITRLCEKGYGEEDAAVAADRLEETGVLDDAAYARTLLSYYGARAYGAGRIREEFRRRGIPRKLWEDVLSEEENDGEQLMALIRRKRAAVTDEKAQRKLVNMLLRRGFSYEQIHAALQQIEEDGE